MPNLQQLLCSKCRYWIGRRFSHYSTLISGIFMSTVGFYVGTQIEPNDTSKMWIVSSIFIGIAGVFLVIYALFLVSIEEIPFSPCIYMRSGRQHRDTQMLENGPSIGRIAPVQLLELEEINAAPIQNRIQGTNAPSGHTSRITDPISALPVQGNLDLICTEPGQNIQNNRMVIDGQHENYNQKGQGRKSNGMHKDDTDQRHPKTHGQPEDDSLNAQDRVEQSWDRKNNGKDAGSISCIQDGKDMENRNSRHRKRNVQLDHDRIQQKETDTALKTFMNRKHEEMGDQLIQCINSGQKRENVAMHEQIMHSGYMDIGINPDNYIQNPQKVDADAMLE